mmetsp:Transcript_53383/g.117207  ORF Transcript_53383/g.117207 Transcript_53383/m.117207 type:complete len:330 (-) Transcript_53383:581-1570(-)
MHSDGTSHLTLGRVRIRPRAPGSLLCVPSCEPVQVLGSRAGVLCGRGGGQALVQVVREHGEAGRSRDSWVGTGIHGHHICDLLLGPPQLRLGLLQPPGRRSSIRRHHSLGRRVPRRRGGHQQSLLPQQHPGLADHRLIHPGPSLQPKIPEVGHRSVLQEGQDVSALLPVHVADFDDPGRALGRAGEGGAGLRGGPGRVGQREGDALRGHGHETAESDCEGLSQLLFSRHVHVLPPAGLCQRRQHASVVPVPKSKCMQCHIRAPCSDMGQAPLDPIGGDLPLVGHPIGEQEDRAYRCPTPPGIRGKLLEPGAHSPAQIGGPRSHHPGDRL